MIHLHFSLQWKEVHILQYISGALLFNCFLSKSCPIPADKGKLEINFKQSKKDKLQSLCYVGNQNNKDV